VPAAGAHPQIELSNPASVSCAGRAGRGEQSLRRRGIISATISAVGALWCSSRAHLGSHWFPQFKSMTVVADARAPGGVCLLGCCGRGAYRWLRLSSHQSYSSTAIAVPRCPVLKQVLPWRSLNSAAEIDPLRSWGEKIPCGAARCSRFAERDVTEYWRPRSSTYSSLMFACWITTIRLVTGGSWLPAVYRLLPYYQHRHASVR